MKLYGNKLKQRKKVFDKLVEQQTSGVGLVAMRTLKKKEATSVRAVFETIELRKLLQYIEDLEPEIINIKTDPKIFVNKPLKEDIEDEDEYEDPKGKKKRKSPKKVKIKNESKCT